jgi:phage terminase large subunit-like protein
MSQYNVYLPELHPEQKKFVLSLAKRKIVRAGRRGGKTIGAADLAVERFLEGTRVLYAVPTSEQKDQFWYTVKHILREPLDAGVFRKSENECFIELENTRQRIKAKTAWNADTLRGDFAGLLILDEYQSMNEDAWGRVGAPMLLDNDGDALFIYTPPSLASRSVSKATDPRHAAKMFKMAQADTSGRWQAFTFSSHANPHISEEALAEIAQDMTSLAYRQEILAEDIDEAPGAQWTRKIIEDYRVRIAPQLERVVVGVDPSATTTGDEAGIIVAGKAGENYYILADRSIQGSPDTWARAVVDAYHDSEADNIIAEKNQGGEMVTLTIKTVDNSVPVKLVHASRGKQVRAEPISALYEQGRVHHVGGFPKLEDELCLWMPGDKSPNRLDALVWAMTELSKTRVAQAAQQHRW